MSKSREILEQMGEDIDPDVTKQFVAGLARVSDKIHEADMELSKLSHLIYGHDKLGDELEGIKKLQVKLHSYIQELVSLRGDKK